MKDTPDGFLSHYHPLTRASTPDSVSFWCFLPFSPWLAPASLRLKSQKSLKNPSLAGARQFCRSRNVSRQGKARREYCRISKGLDAVWAHFCPPKPRLPLLTDGIFLSETRLGRFSESLCKAAHGRLYFLPETIYNDRNYPPRRSGL